MSGPGWTVNRQTDNTEGHVPPENFGGFAAQYPSPAPSLQTGPVGPMEREAWQDLLTSVMTENLEQRRRIEELQLLVAAQAAQGQGQGQEPGAGQPPSTTQTNVSPPLLLPSVLPTSNFRAPERSLMSRLNHISPAPAPQDGPDAAAAPGGAPLQGFYYSDYSLARQPPTAPASASMATYDDNDRADVSSWASGGMSLQGVMSLGQGTGPPGPSGFAPPGGRHLHESSTFFGSAAAEPPARLTSTVSLDDLQPKPYLTPPSLEILRRSHESALYPPGLYAPQAAMTATAGAPGGPVARRQIASTGDPSPWPQGLAPPSQGFSLQRPQASPVQGAPGPSSAPSPSNPRRKGTGAFISKQHM